MDEVLVKLVYRLGWFYELSKEEVDYFVRLYDESDVYGRFKFDMDIENLVTCGFLEQINVTVKGQKVYRCVALAKLCEKFKNELDEFYVNGLMLMNCVVSNLDIGVEKTFLVDTRSEMVTYVNSKPRK